MKTVYWSVAPSVTLKAEVHADAVCLDVGATEDGTRNPIAVVDFENRLYWREWEPDIARPLPERWYCAGDLKWSEA